uniref:C-type natriuretic peptide 2-like n=1 Tax=Labrus bergylta TaxID=56723 RepID=A0A3Q3FEP4_9LABR
MLMWLCGLVQTDLSTCSLTYPLVPLKDFPKPPQEPVEPLQGPLKVLHSLFGSHLSSLILAPPTSDDITEGSAGRPAPSTSSPFKGVAVSRGAARGLAGRQEAVPRFFMDFLQRQSKMRKRSRKSMVGGRGCFGMKMDRIGSISGLGC